MPSSGVKGVEGSEGEDSEEENEVLEESPCGRWRKLRSKVNTLGYTRCWKSHLAASGGNSGAR